MRTSSVRVDGADLMHTAMLGLVFGCVTICFGGIGLMGFAIAGVAFVGAALTYAFPETPKEYCPNCLIADHAKKQEEHAKKQEEMAKLVLAQQAERARELAIQKVRDEQRSRRPRPAQRRSSDEDPDRNAKYHRYFDGEDGPGQYGEPLREDLDLDLDLDS